MPCLLSGAFQVVQVALAEQVFIIGEGGSISLGLMYMAMGIGTGVGPILARVFTGDRDRPLRHAITISYGISAIGVWMTATLSSFSIVLIGTILRGLGGAIGWVFSTQLLLQLLPDQIRGRGFFHRVRSANVDECDWCVDRRCSDGYQRTTRPNAHLDGNLKSVAWASLGSMDNHIQATSTRLNRQTATWKPNLTPFAAVA